MKRAAFVTVDTGDEREVTLRVGVYFGPDSGDAAFDDAVADEVHLVEPSEHLLADLHVVCDTVLRAWHPNTIPGAAAARVRALLPEEGQDGG